MSKKTRQKRDEKQRTSRFERGTDWARLHRVEIYISLGLILASLLVLGQTAGFQFVTMDDNQNIYNNLVVRNGLTMDGVIWAFTTTRYDYWHPLPWLSHMLDVELFGMNPGRHHLTSVLLHIATALLLFWTLRRMTGAVWPSAIVAALFAIHPLRAESVAWVTERKDVLGGLFWWLTTWAYVEYARDSGSRKKYWVAVALFALALMAKPTTMTLPFFLLLLDYWPLGRLRGEAVKGLILEKLPLFALSLASLLVTFKSQQEIGATELVGPLPLLARVANSVVSYATYLVKLAWPTGLAALYPYHRDLPDWQVGGSAALLVVVTGLVIWQVRRRPYLAVGWFWYLGVLLPVSGLLQMGFQARADRFTYIPLTGVLVMVVWGMRDLLSRWRHGRAVAIVLLAVALPALGVRAWDQVATWRDSVTLLRHNVEITPDNHVVLNNLGANLLEMGETDEAIACFSRAVRINPQYADAQDNLGLALLKKGDLQLALFHYSEAIRLKPDFASAWYNRASLLMQMGHTEQAVGEFRKAIDLGLAPQKAVAAETNLGVIAARQGSNTEALPHFWRALSINPSFPESRKDLAKTLAAMGRTKEAIEQFSILLQMTPADAEVRDYLVRLRGR